MNSTAASNQVKIIRYANTDGVVSSPSKMVLIVPKIEWPIPREIIITKHELLEFSSLSATIMNYTFFLGV